MNELDKQVRQATEQNSAERTAALSAMQTAVRATHRARKDFEQLEAAVQGASTHLTQAIGVIDRCDSRADAETATAVAGMIRHGLCQVEQATLLDRPAFGGDFDFHLRSDTGSVDLTGRACASADNGGTNVTGIQFAAAVYPPDLAGEPERVHHIRTRVAAGVASCMLTPRESVGRGDDEPGTVRVVAVPPATGRLGGESVAEVRLIRLPPGAPTQATLRRLRHTLKPLGLRVSRRGVSLLFRAEQGGARGRFKVRFADGAENAWDLDRVVEGVDATVRFDGKPANANGARATFRQDGTHATFLVGGPLAEAGAELTLRVSGGVLVPVHRRVGSEAAWVPLGWPRTRGRTDQPNVDQHYIGLPEFNAVTLGTHRSSLGSVLRVADEGRLLSSTRESLLAALHDLFAVITRLKDATGLLDAALITAAAEFGAPASPTKSAACDAAPAARRSAA